MGLGYSSYIDLGYLLLYMGLWVIYRFLGAVHSLYLPFCLLNHGLPGCTLGGCLDFLPGFWNRQVLLLGLDTSYGPGFWNLPAWAGWSRSEHCLSYHCLMPWMLTAGACLPAYITWVCVSGT